jgi:hypothetical protein
LINDWHHLIVFSAKIEWSYKCGLINEMIIGIMVKVLWEFANLSFDFRLQVEEKDGYGEIECNK